MSRAGAAVLTPEPVELNRRLPLWYQVAQSLRAAILGRSPDAPLRLPTEEHLAGHYGVSVLTMRQALKELQAEGLISRHRRRGTFVEPRAAGAAVPVPLLGSLDAIVAQQSGGRTTLLDHGPVPVPAELAGHFPGLAEVVRYRRLRHDGDGGEPANWAENLVHPRVAERIDPAALERWPMTRVLRDVAGVRVRRITNTVQAGLADPATARLLDVPLLSPVLRLTGVAYDEREGVVDVARIHYRGDRFSFVVTVDSSPEETGGRAAGAE